MMSKSDMLNALPGDKASVRRYVTQAATTALADGSVAVNVSHSNLRQLVQELRFDLHTTIADVKRRLYTFNGSSQGHMELHLKDSDGNLLARMLDESRALGYYGVCSGMNIHVVDTDPFSLSRDGGCVAGAGGRRGSGSRRDGRLAPLDRARARARALAPTAARPFCSRPSTPRPPPSPPSPHGAPASTT